MPDKSTDDVVALVVSSGRTASLRTDAAAFVRSEACKIAKLTSSEVRFDVPAMRLPAKFLIVSEIDAVLFYSCPVFD